MATHTENAVLPATAIAWPIAPRSKWEREHSAFLRLLPNLLQTHCGKFVAIHGEKVVDSDPDEMALMIRVFQKIGNVDIHIGRVTDKPEPPCRSGVVRDLSSAEPA